MGPRHDLSFCACTTACLASELLVSMGPSLHLCFLHAKQRLLDQNNKSLWVPDMTCLFVLAKQHETSSVTLCIQNSDFGTRITCLYGSQSSSVALCIQNSEFGTRLTSLDGSLPSSVVFACKTAPFGPELQVPMGTRPHLSFYARKTA